MKLNHTRHHLLLFADNLFADECTSVSEKFAFAGPLRYMRINRPCAIYYSIAIEDINMMKG